MSDGAVMREARATPLRQFPVMWKNESGRWGVRLVNDYGDGELAFEDGGRVLRPDVERMGAALRSASPFEFLANGLEVALP